MRFVRHRRMVDWGLGVVASDDGANVDVLFESVGRKKLAKSLGLLIDVPIESVPSGHRLRVADEWPKVERDIRREAATRALPERFDGFIKEFLGFFPNGLRSRECESEERDYKVRAAEGIQEELRIDVLERLLEERKFTEIVSRARRCLSKEKLNLVASFELIKFNALPEEVHPAVAERLVRLVGAEENTPAALEELAAVLAPHEAAKWPIVSLFPFMLRPGRWPFVKPTFVERAAKVTGVDVEYDTRPNARTYSLVRDLYQQVFMLLGERGLAPRDFIDVQTFLWVASGMKRDVRDQRASKEDA